MKDLDITSSTVYVDETGLNECSGGILAGKVKGCDTQLVLFENMTASGSVVVTSTYGMNNIGGIIGYASWVKSANCHAAGTVSSIYKAGGLLVPILLELTPAGLLTEKRTVI